MIVSPSAKPRGKPPLTRYVNNIPDVIGKARGDPPSGPGPRTRGDPAPYGVMVGSRGDPG